MPSDVLDDASVVDRLADVDVAVDALADVEVAVDAPPDVAVAVACLPPVAVDADREWSNCALSLCISRKKKCINQWQLYPNISLN